MTIITMSGGPSDVEGVQKDLADQKIEASGFRTGDGIISFSVPDDLSRRTREILAGIPSSGDNSTNLDQEGDGGQDNQYASA